MLKILKVNLNLRHASAKLDAEIFKRFNSSVSPHLIEKMRNSLPKRRKLENIKNIVAVASGKGGVGKSTVAVNLAVALAKYRQLRVGLLDADLYGPSIPLMMNFTKFGGPDTMMSLSEDKLSFTPLMNYGVSCMSIGLLVEQKKRAIIWRGLMVTKALEQLIFQTKWGDLDILIIDMPPGTGDTQLTVIQLIDLSGALIVSTPQDVALMDAQKGMQMFNEVNVPILGIVENMCNFTCPNCQHSTPIFKTDVEKWLLSNHPNMNLLAKIPLDPQVCAVSDDGRPAVISLPPYNQSRKEFENLATNLIKRLDTGL